MCCGFLTWTIPSHGGGGELLPRAYRTPPPEIIVRTGTGKLMLKSCSRFHVHTHVGVGVTSVPCVYVFT